MIERDERLAALSMAMREIAPNPDLRRWLGLDQGPPPFATAKVRLAAAEDGMAWALSAVKVVEADLSDPEAMRRAVSEGNDDLPQIDNRTPPQIVHIWPRQVSEYADGYIQATGTGCSESAGDTEDESFDLRGVTAHPYRVSCGKCKRSAFYKRSFEAIEAGRECAVVSAFNWRQIPRMRRRVLKHPETYRLSRVNSIRAALSLNRVVAEDREAAVEAEIEHYRAHDERKREYQARIVTNAQQLLAECRADVERLEKQPQSTLGAEVALLGSGASGLETDTRHLGAVETTVRERYSSTHRVDPKDDSSPGKVSKTRIWNAWIFACLFLFVLACLLLLR